MRTVTGSRRATAGLAALTVLLFGAGTAAAKNVEPAGGPGVYDIVAGGPTAGAGAAVPSAEAADVPASTPSPVPMPVPPTASPTTAAPSTTSPTISTVHPPASTAASTSTSWIRPTTAAPPTPAAPATNPVELGWPDMMPGGGPPGTVVTIAGAGCFGQGAAVSIDTRNPERVVMARHAAKPVADGTWSASFAMDVPSTFGDYAVAAACMAGGEVLPYPVLTYTMAGPDDGRPMVPWPGLSSTG